MLIPKRHYAGAQHGHALLEDFKVLVELHDVSRAAEARNVTQPAFSRRVRTLERWIGTPLFNRASHRLDSRRPVSAFDLLPKKPYGGSIKVAKKRWTHKHDVVVTLRFDACAVGKLISCVVAPDRARSRLGQRAADRRQHARLRTDHVAGTGAFSTLSLSSGSPLAA